jgi:hypothetical protein
MNQAAMVILMNSDDYGTGYVKTNMSEHSEVAMNTMSKICQYGMQQWTY